MLKIVYQDVYLGGAETLLVRIGKCFIKKKISTTLFCENIFSSEIKDECEKTGIKIALSDNSPKTAFSNNRHGDVYLTVSLYTYIESLITREKGNYSNKLFYYVIHPYNPLHITKSRFVNKLSFEKYKGLLMDSILDGSMFFMDSMCVNEFCKFYCIERKGNFHIIDLPLLVNELNKREIIESSEKRKKEFRILTIARSEFPFKGYLKSLISVFAELSNEYNMCRLDILSSGKDISKLRQWINNANKSIGNKIELYENIPPSELRYYYERASLYIGQGTTVLDACNYGIPALPVEGYTYDIKSNGFFDKANGCFAVPFGEGVSAETYIYNVLNMSDEEYISLSMRCRKAFEDKHNINILYAYLCEEHGHKHIKISKIIVGENIIRRFIRRIGRVWEKHSF